MGARTLETAQLYQNKQLYHAAIDLYRIALDSNLSNANQAKTWDSMGMCYIGLGLPEMASQCFERADSLGFEKSSHLYRIHAALSYSFLGDQDKAQRILMQCLESSTHLRQNELAQIHGNLAYVLSNSEFYRDGLEHTRIALELSASDMDDYRRKSLYINMGYFYLELSLHEQAKQFLELAVFIHSEPYLPAIIDLSRAYMGLGQTEKSLYYAEQALSHIWTAVLNFEKTEIARLCRLTAGLAYYMGEQHLAVRLIEKAQMFFGRLSMWGSWLEARDTFDKWNESSVMPVSYTPSPAALIQLNQFLLLLDAIQAQERLGPQMLTLIDMRVLYSRVIAEELGFQGRDIDDMVYAARFADYGLCALEPEVVANPHRSHAAWEQYVQHPTISVEMLDYMRMSETAKRIILEHHEQYDGSGFPYGKKGDGISILSQTVAVADDYASRVFAGETHSTAKADISRLSGTTYSPIVVRAFERIFEVNAGGR